MNITNIKKNRINFAVTLGPSSFSDSIIEKLLLLKPKYFRFNFSHGNFEENQEIIRRIKNNFPEINIFADLEGTTQRIQIYKKDFVKIEKCKPFAVFSDKDTACKNDGIYFPIFKEIISGSYILIDDSKFQFIVKEIKKNSELIIESKHDGTLLNNKSITIDGCAESYPPIDEKSIDNLLVLNDVVDGLLISHVRSDMDIKKVKQVFKKELIVKIETRLAIQNIIEISKESENILIAQGDLSQVFSPFELPIIQKKLLDNLDDFRGCLYLATGFWESMLNNINPSFSDIFGIYNSLNNGITGFLLTGETASGQHPVESLNQLKQCVNFFL